MKNHRNLGSQTATQAIGVIAVLSHIDSAGFHGIDMALGGASPTIDPSWSSHTRNALIAVVAIDWPDELRPQSKLFTDAAGRLTAALDEGDTKTAAGPAKEVHRAWHTLSSEGWSYLATIAGIQSEGDARQHQRRHQTP